MASFPDTITVRDARAAFFAANAHVFGPDGGYEKRVVYLKMGPFPLWIPKTTGAKRAIPLHDLHHIATGYATDLHGESEIGAWEVAAGCGTLHYAWVLNLWAFAIGLVIAPRRVFRSFVRGRHSETLYHIAPFPEAMLDGTLGELRARLRLSGQSPRPSSADVAWFILWTLIALMTASVPALLIAIAATIAVWLFM